MKILENEFAIIVGTPDELAKAIDCLKKEFEMKDLEREKFCLRLEIGYLNKGIFVHQKANIIRFLKGSKWTRYIHYAL